MVFEYVVYGAAILALLVGSYTDLKKREVPDWVSYGLIFSGLGLRLIFSLAEFNWNIFFEGLVGFLIFVILAYLMYYFGQWGGGDAKLLMGLGAVLGLSFDFSQLPSLATFLINLAAVGTIYGMGWLIFLAFKHKKKFKLEFKKQQGQIKTLSVIFLVMVAAGIAGSFFMSGIFKGFVIVVGIVPIGSLYIWLLVNSIEKVAFHKRIKPEDLTEGDWIAEDIEVNGEKICGPKDLGINEEQIAKLIQLKKKGKIHKIPIKEGIPFVPSFLLAFVLTVVLGSWWFSILGVF